MLEKLNNELIEIKEGIRVRQKLMSDIERTAGMLYDENTKLKNLDSIVKKENDDVKKLEGLSLTGLFYAVLSDKDSRLDKERQEYMSALLKYEACKRSVSSLEQDIENLKLRIASLGELDNKYDTIIEKKERLISQGGNAKSREVLELSESIADTKSDFKEIGEAISAGKKAMCGLDKVISLLKSAKNWGTYDMLGGGFISTAVKHSKIDDAKEAVYQVQQQLRFFQRELADIGTNTEIKIEIGSFSKFGDYFFDGLIFDWAVQSKINKSLDSAVQVSERINRVVRHLLKNYKEAEEKYNNLELQKRRLIEQA
ncbi:MAG: hypothetical protein JXA96_18365 [Sedimentisphaerales bacterium]|nr:hypothetical protein [Sedimentisphaerales bacterium]